MKDFVGKKIVGTWKLVSWKYENKKGKKVDFFGKKPEGILVYDNCGFMSVQIMKSDRPDVNAEGLMAGSDKELSKAFTSYFAYYGTYEEVNPGEMVHTVVGSLTPNWLGDKHTRYAKIKGRKLIISTPKIPTKEEVIIHHIIWKKLKKTK